MNAAFLSVPLLANWFTDMYSGLMPDNRFALLVVLVGCGTGVVCTLAVFISGTITAIHQNRVQSDLKREMIERGMSADEIAKIIEAAPPEDAAQRWIAS